LEPFDESWCFKKKNEDTKGPMKRDKIINNDTQNTTQKTKD